MSQIKDLILSHPRYRHDPTTREVYRSAIRIERRVRAWRKKEAARKANERIAAMTEVVEAAPE